MSCNFYGIYWLILVVLVIIKGIFIFLDLVSIIQGEEWFVSFFSQVLGVIVDLDLGIEYLCWMGVVCFIVGFFMLVLQKKIYFCDIVVKVEIEYKESVKWYYWECVMLGSIDVEVSNGSG